MDIFGFPPVAATPAPLRRTQMEYAKGGFMFFYGWLNAALVLALVLLLACSSPSPTDTAQPTPTSPQVSTTTAPSFDAEGYVLYAINSLREQAGVPPLELGDNPAAQAHADDLMENCLGGHWGSDGLRGAMRYTLAGGDQANSENTYGVNFCEVEPEASLDALVEEAMQVMVDSPGHYANMVNPWWRKVNIGIAYQPDRILRLVQQFEGGFVRFDQSPVIQGGELRASGEVLEGVRLDPLDVMLGLLYYDPMPEPATLGQSSYTVCEDIGLFVGALRPPETADWPWEEDFGELGYQRCTTPAQVPGDAEPPESVQDALQRTAVIQRKEPYIAENDGLWLEPVRWEVGATDFDIAVDVSPLLVLAGQGVYTLMLWGVLDGDPVPVAVYPIFEEG